MDNFKWDQNQFSLQALNSLFLGISHLADKVPMGGKNYVEMACDSYAERMFYKYCQTKFNPVSNSVIDLCTAWIEIMNAEGFLDSNDYQFTNGADCVHIQVNPHNCTYYDYCTAVQQDDLPVVCPRMLSCKWIVTNYTGRQYQLKTGTFAKGDCCRGTLYPGETTDEILTRDGDNISVAGERAIVLSTNAYGILLKTIYDYAPHLLERVLYESSYYSSLLEYDKVASNHDSSRETVQHLLNTVQRLGNIRYEIIEFDERNKRAVVKAYGSYMADIFQKYMLYTSPKASCASGRGRLAAYFTKAWKEEIVCEEMRCEAYGDDCCEFCILPRSL